MTGEAARQRGRRGERGAEGESEPGALALGQR